MIRGRVDLQLAIHRLAEFRLREHAADGFLHETNRLPRADDLRAFLAKPAFVPGVPAIDLLLVLASGQTDAGGVNDDDVVASIEIRKPGGLVLALQDACGAGRDAPQHLTVRVDKVPLPLS